MKKVDISILLIIGFFLILVSQLDILKKTYFVLSKNYDTRFQKAYENDHFSGYCKKESHGYIQFLKTEFKIKYPPKIINLEKKKRKLPHWIFYKKYNEINSNEVILLGYNENLEFDFESFKVLDNYNNKCFYLKKK